MSETVESNAVKLRVLFKTQKRFLCARVVSLMYHQDVQQNPDFYWPNFKKQKRKEMPNIHMFIQDPI